MGLDNFFNSSVDNSFTNKKTKYVYPVSLSDVKSHLRIDASINDDDTYLSTFIIPAATRRAENFIGKDIAWTKNVYIVNDFFDQYLKVNEGNLLSMTYIITDASKATSYTELDIEDGQFYIELPTAIDSDPLTLQFVTGYDTSTSLCPEEIKQAVLIECGNLYDMERNSYTYNSVKRGDVFERLLLPHKVIRW